MTWTRGNGALTQDELRVAARDTAVDIHYRGANL
jgi:hypothetical protein